MNALIILFYRIVTFFTRVPKKTRDKHSLIYRDFSDFSNSFIENQNDFTDLPYGKGNFAANGCGPIAIYNALLALNNNAATPSLSDIMSFMERKGAALFGKFGTSPIAIAKYFMSCGYTVKTFMKRNSEKLNEFSKSTDNFISIVQMDKTSLKTGFHFIFTHKNEDGTFTAHNPNIHGETLFETLNSCSLHEISHVCTIGINNK